MKVTRNLTCFFIIVFAFSSCAQSVKNKQTSLVVCSWNVQNLFDAVNNGTEYDEYKTSGGWTDTYYRNRLKNIDRVAAYEGFDKADICILNEVENEAVVKDILELSNFKSRGFTYYAVAGEENGAICTAVISRIPITVVRIHSCEDSRPILEVTLDFNSNKVFVLAIHAKSNLGDDDENAQKRLYLAKQINLIAENIKVDYPMAGIIVAGDFNEEISLSNMMADMRYESNKYTDCPLRILCSDNSKYWYSMWADSTLTLSAEGSYYYSSEWKGYDNILVYRAKVLNAGVVFDGVLKSQKGQPNRWIRDLLSGVSDHLPVWVEVVI